MNNKVIKIWLIVIVIDICCIFLAKSEEFQRLSENEVNRIADAIYKIEGAEKTKYPYGIRSIDTKGNKEYARKICLNTILNNWKRYNKLNKTEKSKYHCYLDFLGSKYCPYSVDPIGHRNWIKNIHTKYLMIIP